MILSVNYVHYDECMGYVKDLIGKKFGRLHVISQVEKRNKNRAVYWECKCDCGNTKIVTGNHLKTGHTKSCGCLYDPEMNTKHGYNRRSGTKPEYNIWCNMKNRCQNPEYKEYHLYGGRGIKVCDRWSKFENFIEDMGDRPSKIYSLDRENNDLGYSPDNCRWATIVTQQRNKRSNRWIEYNGKRMILKEWADYFNTTPQNLHRMLKSRSIEYAHQHYKT